VLVDPPGSNSFASVAIDHALDVGYAYYSQDERGSHFMTQTGLFAAQETEAGVGVVVKLTQFEFATGFQFDISQSTTTRKTLSHGAAMQFGSSYSTSADPSRVGFDGTAVLMATGVLLRSKGTLFAANVSQCEYSRVDEVPMVLEVPGRVLEWVVMADVLEFILPSLQREMDDVLRGYASREALEDASRRTGDKRAADDYRFYSSFVDKVKQWQAVRTYVKKLIREAEPAPELQDHILQTFTARQQSVSTNVAAQMSGLLQPSVVDLNRDEVTLSAQQVKFLNFTGEATRLAFRGPIRIRARRHSKSAPCAADAAADTAAPAAVVPGVARRRRRRDDVHSGDVVHQDAALAGGLLQDQSIRRLRQCCARDAMCRSGSFASATTR
jgi:hypothetical protein